MGQPPSLGYEAPQDRVEKPPQLNTLGTVAVIVGLLGVAGGAYLVANIPSTLKLIRRAHAEAAARFAQPPMAQAPEGATPFTGRSGGAGLEDRVDEFLEALNEREQKRLTPAQLGSVRALVLKRLPELDAQRRELERFGRRNSFVSYAIVKGGVTLEVKLLSIDRDANWIFPDGRVLPWTDSRVDVRTGAWRADLTQALDALWWPVVVSCVLGGFRVMMAGWLFVLGVRLLAGSPGAPRAAIHWGWGLLALAAAGAVVNVWMIAVWPTEEVRGRYGLGPTRDVIAMAVISTLVQVLLSGVVINTCRDEEVQAWASSLGG